MKFSKSLLATTLGALIAMNANASLYVSPAKKLVENKADMAFETVPAKVERAKDAEVSGMNHKVEAGEMDVVKEIDGGIAVPAIATMDQPLTPDPAIATMDQPLTPDSNASLGVNVPLYMALESIAPMGFKVRVDEKAREASVSWKDAKTVGDAVDQINTNENIFVVSNPSDAVIAASTNKDIAKMLANQTKGVWPLEAGRSMKESFELWAASKEWEVSWGLNVDYPINHNAFLKGDLKSALVEMAKSVSETSHPISVVMHAGNKVIQVIEGGYRSQAGVK